MKKIIITVEGGIITNIDGIPNNTKVEIWDFDTDGTSEDQLETNKQGEKYILDSWFRNITN